MRTEKSLLRESDESWVKRTPVSRTPKNGKTLVVYRLLTILCVNEGEEGKDHG